MRLLNAIISDIRFQSKQGFYLVYVIITVMYLIILSLLPESFLRIALPLVVFSDPSVLGLFFIGGIIMLEKGQGVIQVLVVSPLTTVEYIIAKVISLSVVAVVAASAITILSSSETINWFLFLTSVVLTSGIFTLCGVVINAGCNNVNQYILKTIPYMLLLVLPCFSILGAPLLYPLTLVPSVAALRLMLGAFTQITWYESAGLTLYLLLANYLLFRYAVRIFENKIVFQD
ncbi:MAG: ABC transporter [Bacteroidetes bacterium HGW-Bacteroidetes-5]|jgi:fluoroquinolone transport system permease protein|nr:MAG: ABC transporter [Bacteroidetes bacterium HGW-Bacteroidetes-5]